MSKDNITIQSPITTEKNIDSAITEEKIISSGITTHIIIKSPIGVESINTVYSNGAVTNSFTGETAVFDFDVIANFSGDVVFTVDWGAQIGTTIINTTLVSGVSKSLQTTITIPLDADISQAINVSDSLDGSYGVDYDINSLILQNDANGIAYATQTDAYGLMLDAIINKVGATNTLNLDFISDRNSGTNFEIGNGYTFIINSSEQVTLRRNSVSDSANIFRTNNSYVSTNTDYRVLIWRNSVLDEFVAGAVGTFAAYIQGKAKPITITKYLVPDINEMELIVATIGLNPGADNIHITSLFAVTDFDVGDQISRINVNGVYISPNDFTVLTGAYSVISSA